MMKTNPNSRLEVWGSKYINEPRRRQDKDKCAVIIQIEPTPDPDGFMVEVLDV